MKIETVKDFGAARSNYAKQSSGANASSPDKTDGASDELDSSGSDFASVLESLGGKEKSAQPKDNNAVKNKTREDKTNDVDPPAKKSLQNDERRADKSKTESSDSDVAAALNARAIGREIAPVEAETAVPPARQILHIADLERMISTIRTTAFDNSNQVEITLKNSVFSGLKIKLTADENRRITAEFVAGNEKVKAQIDERSGELANILRQRGVKLAGLQTSVGAETSDRNNARNPFEDLSAVGARAKSNAAPVSGDDANDDAAADSQIGETAGHTYRV